MGLCDLGRFSGNHSHFYLLVIRIKLANFMRTIQISWLILITLLSGMLLGSSCKQLWESVVFISVSSLLVPAILLATGKLKVPLIQSVSFYGFIGFSLFGGIILLAGLFGTFTNAGFLSNACAGTDLATRFAIRALGYAARGL